MLANQIRAVIFDLDGLVIDSESGYCQAWQQAAAAMGFELDDEFCGQLSGESGAVVINKIANYCGADFDYPMFTELSGQCWQQLVQQQGIAVKTGFRPLLDALQTLGLPYGLATNSHRNNAEYCLQLAGLSGVFEIIVSRDDVSQPKPSPEVFQTAAAQLGLAVERCLVLEDSALGLAAALAAGTPCILVPSGAISAPLAAQACQVMTDLQQVADFIQAQVTHPL